MKDASGRMDQGTRLRDALFALRCANALSRIECNEVRVVVERETEELQQKAPPIRPDRVIACS